ncbi:MAG TPA: cytochrome c [Rhodoblastus sp.]|nr:cytochrome c [Rhodoblastus sp.]
MRFLALIGALAIAGAFAAAGFFFGGFFDISTSWEDPAPVAQAIARVRDASIARHATDKPPADYAAPQRVQAGARVFATLGCVNCHGGPGVKWQKFSEGMNPAPPDLKEEAARLEPADVFWIAKNGIRMTGMPGFGAAASEDQLWSLAAFVKKLPDISDADYASWTAAPAEAPKQ